MAHKPNADFTELMEAGRDAAAARRHRGLVTGKSAAGWNVKPRYDGAETWEGIKADARLRWEADRDEALNRYATAMFPERYADLPF